MIFIKNKELFSVISYFKFFLMKVGLMICFINPALAYDGLEQDLFFTNYDSQDSFLLAQSTASSSLKEQGVPEYTKLKKMLWVAHLLREKKSKKVITNLNIEVNQLPVYLVPQGDLLKPLVQFKLSYLRPGWKLYLDGKEAVRVTDVLTGEHGMTAYLKSRTSTVELSAVGPNGETETETLFIFAPEAREYKMGSLLDSILFTIGHSYLAYRQTSFGTFVSQALLVGAKYISPENGKKLRYFGDGFLTIYTYTSSPIKENPQFFEARGGVSYLVNLSPNPQYRTRFTLGVSTINLFSLGSPFGFSGLYGMNLGVRTEFYESAQKSYSGEFQITPYDGNLFEQRSIKLSVFYTKNLESLRRLQYGISYSNHQFSEGSEKVNADQINLSASLSF